MSATVHDRLLSQYHHLHGVLTGLRSERMALELENTVANAKVALALRLTEVQVTLAMDGIARITAAVDMGRAQALNSQPVTVQVVA